MKAIVTKYHGPTDHHGARIVATAEGVPRLTVSWSPRLGDVENHREAAAALIIRQGWAGEFVTGCLPDGRYAHVFVRG